MGNARSGLLDPSLNLKYSNSLRERTRVDKNARQLVVKQDRQFEGSSILMKSQPDSNSLRAHESMSTSPISSWNDNLFRSVYNSSQKKTKDR